LEDFLVGLNKPCFGGQYDHDLGNNQFSKWDPYLPKNLDLVRSFFREVQGIDIVRIWLFEGMEGLIFDDNNEVVSIERTFLESLKTILDWTAQNNIRAYLCLFDAWAPKHRPATVNAMSLIIHGTRFINTLTKLCNFLSNYTDTIFAIDLMNEPEGLIKYNIATRDELAYALNKWCKYLHNHHRHFKCSVGWMRRENASKYSYLDVDFCDFHIYNKSGEIPYYDDRTFEKKRCIIGECGYPVVDDSPRQLALRRDYGVWTAKKMIIEARNKSYHGILPWPIDGPKMDEANRELNSTVVQLAMQLKADATYSNNPPHTQFRSKRSLLDGLKSIFS
jgi:hypothetical protein